MTASELIRSVGALPVARRVGAAAPISASIEVAGIEVATAGPSHEDAMRRTWRDRHRGATALLLVADQPGQASLAVLGPSDGGGPIRQVDPAALEQLLRRIASMPRLEAVRELASDLERLDQAGIPGLRLRDLLTMHTLDNRLRNDQGRWAAAEALVDAIPVGSDWRGVLMSFGYEVDRLPTRGYLLRTSGRPIAVVHPKADASEFAKLDPDGRPPEGALLNDCVSDGVQYGLLVTGSRFRLFDFDGTAGSTSRYIDMDSGLLSRADRPLLALLAPPSLASGGFATLVAEAAAFGAALRRRLDDRLREGAFPALARGLEGWARVSDLDFTNEAQLTELEKAALTLVFRLLFLLFAESSRYLPMDNRAYEQSSLTSLAAEAAQSRTRLGERSTSLWDRTQVLVRAMRTGNPAWRVPAYNGALFAPDEFDGAATLERVVITDPDFADLLIAIGRDSETGTGVDYSTLEIGHLGHIYEALLSLRLSPAPGDLVYDAREDRYRPAAPGEPPDVRSGSLLWQTHEGGRKTGGVYYTRSELVRHLVTHSVSPAFERHLEEVQRLAERDAAAAAQHLLSFAVVDPACGSAHFLVEVVNQLADRTARFLAEHPLPPIAEVVARLRSGALPGSAIDDVVLIRRLLLKHCVYGIDISPMGAEVAKLSLWLASFVPGLSLAYLDGNLRVGNSLIGVVRTESVGGGKYVPADWVALLRDAAAAAARAAAIDDRNPDEVLLSQRAGADASAASRFVQGVFNLWTAEAFGLRGARTEVEAWAGEMLAGRRQSKLQSAADKLAEANAFLHWPVLFPSVFARERPGFDAVVGNPPWNEVTVERLAFFAQFRPGLRAFDEANRESAIAHLLVERPELANRLASEQRRVAAEKSYLYAEYEPMAGDPDVYKYFCQRYQGVLRDGGRMGVVLPRTAFVAKGSASFRRWLFEQVTCHRLDFLLNRRLWMFDTHAQYTIALVAAERALPSADHAVSIAGVASSPEEFAAQVTSQGLKLQREAFGPDWAPPLLRDQSEADLLAKMRHGNSFPNGAGDRWCCFPVREFHETDDKELWLGCANGVPLWKGESFDRYDPHGAEVRWCPDTPQTWERAANRPRAGAESLIAATVSSEIRLAAMRAEVGRVRLAFRDATNRTNSRTVIGCLLPPHVLLVNSAPYLAFVGGGDRERCVCLAIMNSIPFDWQARRFVETHVNYFILEGLRLPTIDDRDFDVIGQAAGQLTCVDERFTDFAAGIGVAPRDLSLDEREHLLVEIDAHVAHAWGFSVEDMALVFRDFTVDAVSPHYRQRLLQRLAEL